MPEPKNRFVVVAGPHCNVLLDTSKRPEEREIWTDRMEPEDATLDRDLNPLVQLLNEVARGGE
jgi:hypothetical protein